MEPIPDRYAHNPLLIILENYVLQTVGQLSPEKEQSLAEVVQNAFGDPSSKAKPDWKRTIRKTFDLPDNTDEVIRQLWAQRQEEADQTQTDLTSEDFARQIVDELFADLNGE